MRISGIDAYARSSAILPTRQTNRLPVPEENRQQEAVRSSTTLSSRNISPQSVLTPLEKQFFARMFPENAGALMQQAAFNNRGRLEVQGLVRGQIFDGKA